MEVVNCRIQDPKLLQWVCHLELPSPPPLGASLSEGTGAKGKGDGAVAAMMEENRFSSPFWQLFIKAMIFRKTHDKPSAPAFN